MWFNIELFLLIFSTSLTTIYSKEETSGSENAADNSQSTEETDSFKYAADDMQSTLGEIIFAVMLFRHGDRYAAADYPTNPHSQYMIEAGEGQLTRKGKNRAFRLGQWTRERYNQLLNDRPYSSELLHMTSTSSERAISSGQLFMAGFYPPKSDETELWHPDIPWQPIPVYVDDNVHKVKDYYCAHFNLEADRVRNLPEIKTFHEDHLEMYKLVGEKRGRRIYVENPLQAIRTMARFYDILQVQEMLKLKHPDWVTEDIYPKGKEEIQSLSYKLQTYTDKMKRFKGGPLLSNIIRLLKEKRDAPRTEKLFHFFSAHDVSIDGALNTLKMWDEKLIPPYSAFLLFELRKFRDDYIVTMFYRGIENTPLKLLDIPNCANPCSLDNFIEVTKSIIPEDLEKECAYLTPDYNSILF